MAKSPVYILKINDLPAPEALKKRMTAWQHEDNEGCDVVVLEFDNSDLMMSDLFGQLLHLGNVIEFRHGYVDEINFSKTFVGIIDDVEGFKHITIRAMEIIYLFNNASAYMSWENATIAEVVGDIADKHARIGRANIETQEIETSKGLYKFPTLAKGPDAPDLTFLQQLGYKIGYRVWLEKRRNDFVLYFKPRGYFQQPTRKYVYGGAEGNVIDFKPKSSIRGKWSNFSIGGYNPKTKEYFEVKATGQDIKGMSFTGNMQMDYDAVNKRYGELGEGVVLTDETVLTPEDAEVLLQGQIIEQLEDTIEATIVVLGDPTLESKMVVEVQGVKEWNGKYYVKQVLHDFNNGYLSVAKLTRNSFYDSERMTLPNLIELVNNKDTKDNGKTMELKG